MADLINLTEAEYEAGATALSRSLCQTSYTSYRSVITDMLSVINDLRRPDPVGTVRRGDDGSVAVRIGGLADEPDDWRVIWKDGTVGWLVKQAVESWPVIYTPVVA